jgi:hypothetical protein
MKKSIKHGKQSQIDLGKDSLKHAIKVAAVVVTLGASFGISVGDVLAVGESNELKAVSESNQIKLDNAHIKVDFLKTHGGLINNGDRLLVIEGKAYIRSKSGKQVPAPDKTYIMQDKTKVVVKGGKIVKTIVP